MEIELKISISTYLHFKLFEVTLLCGVPASKGGWRHNDHCVWCPVFHGCSPSRIFIVACHTVVTILSFTTAQWLTSKVLPNGWKEKWSATLVKTYTMCDSKQKLWKIMLSAGVSAGGNRPGSLPYINLSYKKIKA